MTTGPSKNFEDRYFSAVFQARKLLEFLPELGVYPDLKPFPVNIEPIRCHIERQMESKAVPELPDGYNITFEAAHWLPREFRGMLKRRINGAEILFSVDQHTYYRRFTLCKELSHLIIDDEPHHYTTDIIVLIQQLLTGIPFADGGLDNEATSDWLAELIAIELLLPWKYRHLLGDTATEDTERLTGCPLRYIRTALTYPFKQLSERANNQPGLSPI